MRITTPTATVLCAALLGFAAPVAATETHCEGHEANLKMVQEMTEVLFNQRDDAQAPRFYAPAVLSHNVDTGGGDAQQVPVAQMQNMWRNSKANMPDRKLVNDVIVCNGDLVVARVTITGTMTGPIGAIAPTGKHFATTATDIYRIKDGKVVERWGNNDQITMLKQLGILDQVAAASREAPKK